MIVGTAGHIDHGKTSLVRALTGVDTDRLKEEKVRGISIELGYAYQPLADGKTVLGFIDVPGHERFIHTMLAGATGVDFALLVVAADDGVMPQTLEHLEILDLLRVPTGAVAITKTDRVDALRLEAAQAEVTVLLGGTCLSGAPCFPVSTVTGEGVQRLREHLHAAAAAWREPDREEYFRLAVDRSFTLPGIGTVVTGTVFAGRIHVGEELIVSPAGRNVRVRGLHVQNRPADEGRRGERCAVALAGVGREDVARGDWLVAPFLHAPTDRFDIDLHLLGRNDKPLAHGAPVHVHLGAMHGTGRVALLEGERLVPGASMLSQIVLDTPSHCAAGDICILRDAAATRTLGGGRVLDPEAPARFRRRPERIAALRAWTLDEQGAALAALVEAVASGVDLTDFARKRNRRVEGLTLPSETTRVGERLFSKGAWAGLRDKMLAGVSAFHQNNPDEPGVQFARLHRMLFPQHEPALTDAVARNLTAEGGLSRSGPWLHLPGHAVRLTPGEEALAARVRERLAAGTEPTWVRDLARELGREEAELRRLLLRLLKCGEVLQIVRDLYVTPALAARYADIVQRLETNEGGAPAARFRDESGLGRKRAIQVLEFFDRVGYTRRSGDRHRLRPGAGPAFFSGAS